MRIQLAGIILGSMLVAQFAHAADVAYKLDTNGLTATEPTKMSEPPKLAIVNREWAVPGVEQTSQDLLPRVKFDFAGPPRLRIEASEECRDIGTHLRYPHVGPEWLDDVALPLTRELWSNARFNLHVPVPSTPMPPIPLRGFHGMTLAAER